jgi:HD-GYP domain-containing protein (c-di-GMP phosphodiesterase class II)
MDLIEIQSEQFFLGMSLRFTLRDSDGKILLIKGHTIEFSAQLDGIKNRKPIFVEIDQTDEGVRAMMSSISELNLAGAPIKDFSKYLGIKRSVHRDAKTSETLMQLWGDLESKLSGLLGSVNTASDLQNRVYELDQTMVQLLAQDTTAAQFLLFNRAVTHCESYSARHSLLCAILASSLADFFGLPEWERRSLTCATLTMNVAMTHLQDVLAMQKMSPNVLQRHDIDAHPARSHQLLVQAGVHDPHWLSIVAQHHTHQESPAEFKLWPILPLLCKILQTVDRYTAAMSPRRSRPARTARDALRSVVIQAGANHNEVGTALVPLLGLSPPGTFVKLVNGETAVVLQRGVKPAEPIVACVLNRQDDPIAEPRVHRTSYEPFKVQSTLTAKSIRTHLNLEAMLRLMPRGMT